MDPSEAAIIMLQGYKCSGYNIYKCNGETSTEPTQFRVGIHCSQIDTLLKLCAFVYERALRKGKRCITCSLFWLEETFDSAIFNKLQPLPLYKIYTKQNTKAKRSHDALRTGLLQSANYQYRTSEPCFKIFITRIKGTYS